MSDKFEPMWFDDDADYWYYWSEQQRLEMLEKKTEFVSDLYTRSKDEYPYSYSEYFLFGNRKSVEDARGYYSDRLWQWDEVKFDSLWKKHVGCKWRDAPVYKLSAFLSEYFGEKLEVVGLAEGCNPGNGYPYWVVWTKNSK